MNIMRYLSVMRIMVYAFRDKIRWTSVSDILNPDNEEDLITIAEYIKAIEKNMDALMMVQ